MIKLYKPNNNELLYWEVWKDGKELVIHHGVVGDEGISEDIKVGFFGNADSKMKELANAQIEAGYLPVDEFAEIELVIQFQFEEDEMEAALSLRHHVEGVMNECLGWTGNGHCDGGDIGEGKANIFNYVIDLDSAINTIRAELTKLNMLEHCTLAFLDPEDEEYIVVYPQDKAFSL